MDKTTNLVEQILNNKVLLTAIKNNDIEEIKTILVDELEENYQLRDFIFRDVERENHREDVRSEIEERQQGHLIDCECEWENEYIKKLESLTNEDIECITDKYEDYLGECEYNWRVCLENAIDEFLG